MAFNPTPHDIAWTADMIRTLRDGGLWQIPRNQTWWRVDKTNRVLRLIYGPKDYMFDDITTVCARLGYRTEHAPEHNQTPQTLDAEAKGSGKVMESVPLTRT